MSALAKIIKKLIEKGRTDGLRERIDVLFAAGRLTEEEYNTLVEMLPDEQ